MDNKKPISRWRDWTRFHLPNVLYLLVLLAVGVASYWWITQDTDNKAKGPEKHPELVDSFAQGITLNRTNKDGSIGFVVTAKDVAHYGDKDSTLKTVTLVATPIGQPVMTAVANDGEWSDKDHIIKLKGEVKMTRAGSDEAEEMVLTTEAVDINLYDGLASTEQSYKVTQGKSEMTGKGFKYDYQLRDLILDGGKSERVKATLYGREMKKGP